MIADLRNPLDQAGRQIELAALPIARKILRALLDRAVLVDDAGTGDADERRELEALLLRLRDQSFSILTSRFTAPSRVGSSSA